MTAAEHHPDCEGWMRDWRSRAHSAEAELEMLRAQADDMAEALTTVLSLTEGIAGSNEFVQGWAAALRRYRYTPAEPYSIIGRVRDTFDHKYGSAVEHLGKNHYRVHWDDPTPHQDNAVVPIPSRHFEWVSHG